jgi:hypothetical protein
MATIDKTTGKAAAAPWEGKDRHFIIKDRITLETADLVTANVIQALPVKAGWEVKGTRVKMVTAAGGTTLTADVGITGDDADGFDNDIDLKGVAGTVYKTAIGTDAYGASGKQLTADDTIDLVLTATDATGAVVFDIWAECVDYN